MPRKYTNQKFVPPREQRMSVPEGYKKLAPGVLCRCPKLYREFGDAYCCQGEWGPPVVGDDVETLKGWLKAAAEATPEDQPMSKWQPIETAPLDTPALMWWRPRTHPAYPHPPEHASELSNNRYAEACIIGQVSSHEPGKWWNGQTGTYQDLWHVTHWMPLPKGPV